MPCRVVCKSSALKARVHKIMRIFKKDKGSLGVYAHIPYCVSKCPYCDFNSYAVRFDEGRYARAVVSELAGVLKDDSIPHRPESLESIYIGGGTPTVFSPEAIGYIVNGIKDMFIVHDALETTIEANPGTVSLSTLKGYKDAGVNRISIGAESFDDGILKTLGRAHDSEGIRAAFKAAREAGFDNIGMDLIFGAPGQSAGSWETTLDCALALGPRHISLYGLTIEEGTPFYYRYKGRALLPTEDEEAEMYEKAVNRLSGAGFCWYELSNFGLEGRQSRHNMRYWLLKDYIGLGAGGHSFRSTPGWGTRRWNVKDPETYMERIEHGLDFGAGEEALTRHNAVAEALMLGLRMPETGIDAAGFEARFGLKPQIVFKRLKEFERDGLLQEKDGRIRLTRAGALLSNEVFSSLLASLTA